MIRLGLIGCGEHSRGGHAVPLARYQAEHAGEIELAAACDMHLERAENFCKEFGFQKAYRDFNEMLSGESLNGCIAVVPPERISELGVALLQREIPCVVEKPLAASLAELKKLVDAATSTQTPNMVSMNRRFMPFLNRALASVHDTPRYLRCTLARHARLEPQFLWETAVHAVDTLRYIAGDVRSFDAVKLSGAAKGAWHGINLHFESGIEGRIDVLPTAGMVEEIYDIFGEGFRASVTCPFGQQRGWKTFQNGALVAEETLSAAMPEDVVNGFYDETSAFIRALKIGMPPRPSIADAAPSVELCFAIANRVGN